MAVCLAAFNGVQWLNEQFDSILSQFGVDVTLFVSVDMSTDGTEELVDMRARNDCRIVVLPHGNHFGGAASNFFRLLRDVDFSGFDYVCLADQDDIWLSEKLVRAFDVFQRTKVDAYSSNVVAFWPSGRRILVRKSQPQKRWDFLFEAAGPGCTYVMKVKLAQIIQTFVQKYWNELRKVGLHDWFLYAFTRAHGYQWFIDEYAGVLYRQHQENQVGVNVGWHAFKNRVRKVMSGWGLEQVVLIARLVGLCDEYFVRSRLRGGRIGFLMLAINAGQCRRCVRDRWLFMFSSILLCIVGGRGKIVAQKKDKDKG